MTYSGHGYEYRFCPEVIVTFANPVKVNSIIAGVGTSYFEGMCTAI
jgi:hypothetical protein